MAVEAQHMNLLPSMLIRNGDLMKVNQGNVDMGCELHFAATMADYRFPYYQSPVCDLASAKTWVNKADGGITSNVCRKRPRDSIDGFNDFSVSQKTKISGFEERDIMFQIHQQQSETDRFIALHTEKMKMELEERKKRQSRVLIGAIQEKMVKKLKEKDEEIEKMGRLNWVLQERVKNLCTENQILRDLAQSTEATVNSLRTNLEQFLAYVSDDRHTRSPVVTVTDDSESSCGSSDDRREIDLKVVIGGGGEGGFGGGNWNGKRTCMSCRVEESRVLLLPCRHLCLCPMCGSTLHSCPLCSSDINTSVLVNFS